MIQIPVTTTGNSSVDITLDGITYTILTRLNSRNGRLYASIFLNGEEVLLGLRMVENFTSTSFYTGNTLPKGIIKVVQFNTSDIVATINNTGINLDYSLAYIPEADIVEV